MSLSNRFIIEDKEGNKYYPYSFAEVIYTNDGSNVEQKLSEIDTNVEQKLSEINSKLGDINITWQAIENKPSTFPPSSHTHTASEVGALASNGTAVNASKVANALTLQIAGTTKNTFNGSSAQTFNIPNATTSTSGVMTTAQVTKLNGIATGATKNTVDTAMSSTSTNAVQNKVIYAYIQQQLNNLANGGISVVKSVQRGVSTIESGDYSREIRITAVNVNKAMVNYLGFTSSSNDSSADHRYRGYVRLVDSTTLYIRRANSGGDYTFSWEVVEFN